MPAATSARSSTSTDPEPGAPHEPLVVEPDFLHLTPQLSPDGRLLAYACNRRNGQDLDVFVRTLATGEERCVFAPGGYCEVTGFSPDGRLLGVLRLTERTGDNDLHLVDLSSGETVHVAPEEDDARFGAPAWACDSRSFVFSTDSGETRRDRAVRPRERHLGVRARGRVGPRGPRGRRGQVVRRARERRRRLAPDAARPDDTPELRVLELPDAGVVDAIRLSEDGRWLAYGFSSPRRAWEAFRLTSRAAGPPRRSRRLPSGFPPDELRGPSLRRFASFDGESIPYLLFEPAAEPPWPVVVEVHGGPESQRRPMWMPVIQYLVAHGYAVAQPNVRGSTGYGKRYEHLDDGRLRLDSVRDMTTLRDELVRDPRIDGDRVVLYGGSYGGYMVLAGLAFEPTRWAAGIAVVAISHLVTFLRNTSAYRRALREREYGSLEHDLDFLTEVSPLTHVDRMEAPLLLIHGANDPRVPLSEAEQLHRALRDRGIPCELLVYPDEGHGLQKLHNKLDAYPKAVAFLDAALRR